MMFNPKDPLCIAKLGALNQGWTVKKSCRIIIRLFLIQRLKKTFSLAIIS
jgi:hypothetical protein